MPIKIVKAALLPTLVAMLMSKPVVGEIVLFADEGFEKKGLTKELIALRAEGSKDVWQERFDSLLDVRKTYRPLVEKSASKYPSTEPGLIEAVIAVESLYNAEATSKKGAAGLMQLMPNTAKGLGVTDRYDAKQSIEAGTRYLAGLIEQHGSVSLGLAAYNAGPEAVKRYGGIPPFDETQKYVKSVMGLYRVKKSRSGVVQFN